MQASCFLEQWGVLENGFPGSLERDVRQKQVLKNELVLHHGMLPDGFYMVLDGAVKIFRNSLGGQERVIEILRQGDCFGEIFVLPGIPCDVTVQALENTSLLHIPKKVMADLIEEAPASVRKLLGLLSRRIHGLMYDLESVSVRSGHERVADYILSLRPPEKERHEEFEIQLPAKKLDLASRLDLTPQHFSRILQDLRKQGLISVAGRVVRVRSAEGLRNGRMRFL